MIKQLLEYKHVNSLKLQDISPQE